MKKIVSIITSIVILSSCATTKVGESSRKETIREKSVVQQQEIKQAVDMRRFLIKFDRLYSRNGGSIDLKPAANYIIMDGDRVVISAAYLGRQYSFRPVRGIDMVGKVVSFELKNKAKGGYDLKMKVKNDQNTFDVSVTISDEGYCDASLSSYKIDYIRYRGNFIPLKTKDEKAVPNNIVI